MNSTPSPIDHKHLNYITTISNMFKVLFEFCFIFYVITRNLTSPHPILQQEAQKQTSYVSFQISFVKAREFTSASHSTPQFFHALLQVEVLTYCLLGNLTVWDLPMLLPHMSWVAQSLPLFVAWLALVWLLTSFHVLGQMFPFLLS